MAVIYAILLLPLTGGEEVVGSNPAAPTNFSKKTKNLKTILVSGLLLMKNFGAKFEAKNITN